MPSYGTSAKVACLTDIEAHYPYSVLGLQVNIYACLLNVLDKYDTMFKT